MSTKIDKKIKKQIKKLNNKIQSLEEGPAKFWQSTYPTIEKMTAQSIALFGLGLPFFFGWVIFGHVGGFIYEGIQDCRIHLCEKKIRRLMNSKN